MWTPAVEILDILGQDPLKRQAVVVLQERGGESLPAVFKTEAHALSWVKRKLRKGTALHADEAALWNAPDARYEVRRINHQAENYFSPLRRGEIGHHHHISGPYLIRFAQEDPRSEWLVASWQPPSLATAHI